MLKLPIIIFIFIVLTAVMISYDFQQVSAQVSNSTTTNSTSVPSRVITLGDNTAGGIAYDPIYHTMYVANSGSNTVSIINTTTNSVIGNPVTGDNNATGIAYDPIHHRMYMTHNHDLFYPHYTNSCPAPIYACHKGNVTAIS